MKTLIKLKLKNDKYYYEFSDDLIMTSVEIIRLMLELRLFDKQSIKTDKINFKECSAPLNPEKFSKVPMPLSGKKFIDLIAYADYESHVVDEDRNPLDRHIPFMCCYES